ETPDQAAAISAAIDNMKSGKPMDRLVCGDVGFGKTEVALRAAFVAVADDMQVAVLAPTTLLAEQHFNTFGDRFAEWPIKLAELSRFRSGKETTAALKGLASGEIDIAIGTHKLLQKDVKFKRLGLVIVDEEHRFGVRQKEALKALRAEVDVNLYADMLDHAVRSLKAGREPDLSQPFEVTTEVNLHFPALLPASYCADVHERLVLYKRFANCASAEQLEAMQEELVDRFG